MLVAIVVRFLGDDDVAVAVVAVVVVQLPLRELQHELQRDETEAYLLVEDFEASLKSLAKKS